MIQRHRLDAMGIGLVFAVIVIWLASEYRRRRIA